MKTLKDLAEMRNKCNVPFGTQYDYFFDALVDCYIAKTYGVERIRTELKNWDKEAQEFIVGELADRISEKGIIEFDKNEILSLI